LAGRAADHRWILADSRPLRLFNLFVLYIAQGVPLGLFWVAIPAWMAANGASVADVGYVLGMTSIPWTLKLVNGFIMDRYTFLAMGRRRVWIIGSQLVMILLLLGCALIGPGVKDIWLLGLAGFLVNMATTFQDVAVDGLAVDIMQEDERARASGMMFGGQAIGMAASTALTGIVIARLGSSAAYLLSAAFIGLITLMVILQRERAGERLLPWSRGEAHRRNLEIHVGAWSPILAHTFRSMILPLSLLWIPVLLVQGFHTGMFNGMTPIIGTQYVGWGEEGVTGVSGLAQIAAGIAGLTIGGWMGDRYGAKNATIVLFVALLSLSATMRLTLALWSDPAHFSFFVYAWNILNVLITVASLPISMRLCDPRVAATQFTLYMACANFGGTLGSWTFGLSDVLGGIPMMFVLVFALHMLGLVLLLSVKFPLSSASEAQVAKSLASGDGPLPRQE